MIQVVFAIISWFPHMCHLSVQLESSAGRAIRPDCRRQKGISHRLFAAVSRSLRCHGADVTEAWFLYPAARRRQSISGGLMVYSNIQVDLTAGESVATVLQLQNFATSGVHQLFNSTRRTVMSKHFMIT